MTGDLPKSLIVSDKEYPIRSDFRDILLLFDMYSDPDLDEEARQILSIYLLFEDFESTDSVYDAIKDGFSLSEAMEQIAWFVSCRKPSQSKEEKSTFDWEQDEQMLFASVNKVAGKEIRECEYLHWWTFLGYFNTIDNEDTYSFIMNIRYKINHGKKLEKNEREFLIKNRDIVEIKPKLTKEEQEAEDYRTALLNEVLG